MATPAQTQNLPPDTNAGGGILAEAWILLIAATTLLGLRVYTRIWVTRNWGWDESTIVFAWACNFVANVLMTIEVRLGLGRHIVYVPNPEEAALTILKYNTFFQVVIVLCTLFTKISIGIYILRIKNNRTLRVFMWILMSFMTAVTIVIIAVLMTSCVPLEKLWNPTLPGQCLALQTVYNVAYIQSGFTIFTDLCLTVSPIIILWNVKIQKGRKTFICFLTSLGLIATLSNALRNVYEPGLTSPDFTYAIIPISVVSILEQNSGIIAACTPAIMPLFRRRKMPSSTYGYSVNGRSGLGRSVAPFPEPDLVIEGDTPDTHSLTTLNASNKPYFRLK